MKLSQTDLRHVIDHTAELWPLLRGKRLFLTGGTGFFGRWLIETYLAAREAFDLGGGLCVLTRDEAAFTRSAAHLTGVSGLETIQGGQPDFAWPDGRFEVVIHAAVEYGQPLAMLESNQLGMRRVLAFAAERGTEQVLFTSSGAVYGTQPPELCLIDEEHASAPNPLMTTSVYGEIKRLGELSCLVRAESSGFECKIARCFAFVGPHLAFDKGSAIGDFLSDALQGRAVRILGDGTPVRSYLYAADLAIWLWKILLAGKHARAYNVGSDEPHSLAEVAGRVATQVMRPGDVDIAQTPTPNRRPPRYVPSIRRARDELGLEVWIGLDEAIRRTLAWHNQFRAKGQP